MTVEFTARQVNVTKPLRTLADAGIERIGRILGKTVRAGITLRTERHLNMAEITIKARVQSIVAAGKGATMETALRQALAHAELQAQRYRDRRVERKRLPKDEKIHAAPPLARPKTRAAEPELPDSNGHVAPKTRASIAVHSFPARKTVVEPHILKSGEAIALKPLTMEEAVKEAEFRDRDLLIFRNPAGELFVLHRRRDGQMELVEIP